FSNTKGQKKNNTGNTIYLDGITGATASIKILNQTLLSSALKVARANLGFGTAKSPEQIAKIHKDIFMPFTWNELLNNGLIFKTRHHTQSTSGKPLMELYVANLAIPSVGKNLLSTEAWEFLQDNLQADDHAFLVVSTGTLSFVHDKTLRGGISDRLLLRQEGLPIELRDLDFADRFAEDNETFLKLPPALKNADWLIYRVIDTSGIDIALPLSFSLEVDRNQDAPYSAPERVNHHFDYEIPSGFYYEPLVEDHTWKGIWRDKWRDIALLATALMILSAVLIFGQRAAKVPYFFDYFRPMFLVFTLFFIGWYAQGQLSIVNITGAIQSLISGGDISFFLYDPMTTLLWLFTLATFVIWGRGTFCGWLCPFGALQELIAKIAQHIGIKHKQLSTKHDHRLKFLKYICLGAILIAAFGSASWTDKLVEIEPFKTSITVYFDREWPYVIWAIITLLISLLFYKGFCRYLCPLGAVMAILGRLRLQHWLSRRDECGSPCQLCKTRCEYGAINPSGKINYNECFQCMDCVVIYQSPQQCVPLIIQA
ncbi:MAG: 4Fe-4S binding protein, partial [Pontibacterium sp.]